MIVSHQHRFIFLKSRKTAGSSVQIALAAHCGDKDVITGTGFEREIGQIGGRNIPHVPAAKLRKLVGRKVWDGYYKFCFIRNPWDLTVSRYFWDLQQQRTSETVFTQWVKDRAESSWKDDRMTLYSHIGSQQAVDFVGRYEQLAQDYAAICRAIGLPCGELPHSKARQGERKHYSSHYDDEAIEIVRRIHRDSIEEFGYEYETA